MKLRQGEHYYQLSYLHDEAEINTKFNGDISLSELRDNLRSFLLACSWSESSVSALFREEEEI